MMGSAVTSEQCATTEEIREKVQKKDVYIIDVRNPHELGHNNSNIIKADTWINIPLPDFKSALELDDEAFKSRYGLKKPCKQSDNLIINCGLGGRSEKALLIAANDFGYNKAKHYPGGYKRWNAEHS